MDNQISNEEFEKLLREKAKAGNPFFQYIVGCCYDNGYGVEQNSENAVKWLTLAAEQGDSRAQFKIGCAFDFGKGAEQDNEQAVKWYKLSAEQEHPIAQNNLAVCYRTEQGVTKNYDEAFRLYTLSAKTNYWNAFWGLAILYYYGQGVEQNLERAKEYYEKALAFADESHDYWNWSTASEPRKQFFQNQIDEINATLAELETKAAAAQQAKRTEIFISYAHKDMREIDYIDELSDHLKSLSRTEEITWWNDQKLKAGDDWDKEIKGAISKAKVAILMVSAPFFASDYIWRDELQPILESAEETGATVLWVLVNNCGYKKKGIDKYQAVKISDSIKALTECNSAERAKIYTELTKRIEELSPKQETTTP